MLKRQEKSEKKREAVNGGRGGDMIRVGEGKGKEKGGARDIIEKKKKNLK